MHVVLKLDFLWLLHLLHMHVVLKLDFLWFHHCRTKHGLHKLVILNDYWLINLVILHRIRLNLSVPGYTRKCSVILLTTPGYTRKCSVKLLTTATIDNDHDTDQKSDKCSDAATYCANQIIFVINNGCITNIDIAVNIIGNNW